MLEQMKASFLNPPDEFTPIPFWFWNDALDEQEIIRQIRDFHEKGVRGFVIHPRIGIPKAIEYLSDRFMELVSCAVEEAARLGMKVVLYDEAMYPSGSAHGMVVKNHPDYASKALQMKEYPCLGTCTIVLSEDERKSLISVQAIQKSPDQIILTDSIRRLEVKENEITFSAEEGENWSILIFTEVYTKGHIRGIHFGEDDGEDEAPPSSDLLNRAAIEEFIRLTHDRYYEVLGKHFGETIIGMFTDEPGIMGRGDMTGLIPWTGGFLDYILERGCRETDLPLLWFEAGEYSSAARRKYEAAVNKRMEESYYQPIYEWCEAHRIALTGHPEKSDDIGFLKYFHIPAQDVVWRWVAPENGLALEGTHSTMAKCTSDSARHRGMRRNGNECFACCGKERTEWAFSADDMKWYMDWLFVRGVNLLYPHAFFYSIDGPRRFGERPPDVGPNNIWWPYYNQFSDYIKRMCSLMTDCVNQAQVAVLCEPHHLPWRIVKPLYENQVEFNYLELELFESEECRIQDASLNIANQTYRVILIEDIELLEEDSSFKLQRFLDQGGTVIVYNPQSAKLNISKADGITSLDEVIGILRSTVDAEVILEHTCKELRVSHFKKQDMDFYLLVNEGEKDIDTRMQVRTAGSAELWDAWKGTISCWKVKRYGITSDEKQIPEEMELELKLRRRESVILCVNRRERQELIGAPAMKTATVIRIPEDQWDIGISREKLMRTDSLRRWNEVPGMEHYSGSMFYRTEVIIDGLDGDQDTEPLKNDAYQRTEPLNSDTSQSIELDLGLVYEIAEVTLNGHPLGVRMWAPYVFDLTDVIRAGRNELLVEVKNTLANKLSDKSFPSGLIGPVRITLQSF